MGKVQEESDVGKVPIPTGGNGSTSSGGAHILDEVARTFLRYVSMTPHQADTLALYVAHTHAFDAARRTPYIYLTSAEKRSGKSRTLEIARHLVREPLPTANISPAALFRVISSKKSTVLFDEVDGVFGGHKSPRNEDLRVLLNAGFERGTPAYRCAGKDGLMVVEFDVYCPKMLAGLRNLLPDTVRDRSIILELRRKAPNEAVEEFTEDSEDELTLLRESLESWVVNNLEALRIANPDRPRELHDRARDIWKPLLAIADLAGGTWPKRARNAAITLCGAGSEDDQSKGVRLLADLRDIHAEHGQEQEKVFSKFLVEKLGALEESPWGPRRGRDFDQRDLADLLRPFGIKPEKKTLRIREEVGRGYLWSSFLDPWTRYLVTPEKTVTSVTTATACGNPVTDVTDEGVQTSQPLHENTRAVTLVTDVTVKTGVTEDFHAFTIDEGDPGTHCTVCKAPWADHGKPARSKWVIRESAEALFAYAAQVIK